MTPSEVLKVKAAVRQRDGFRCIRCGMTNAQHVARYGRCLEVHRTVPGSAYSTAPGVCETLCKTCHGPKPKRPHGTFPPVPRIDAGVIYLARIVAAFDGIPLAEYISRRLAPVVAADLAQRRNTPPPAPEARP